MFVHRARAAMQEHDFPAVGSSVLFEGMGQKGYGMLNNQNQTAAFESEEPKYVKILKSDYFLSFSRPSFHPKFRLQNIVICCMLLYAPWAVEITVGAVYSPDIGWHLSEITKSRRKKNFKRRGAIKQNKF